MIAIPITYSVFYGFAFLIGLISVFMNLPGRENRKSEPYKVQTWIGSLFISAFSIGLIRILEGTWGTYTISFLMWAILGAGLQANRIGKPNNVTWGGVLLLLVAPPIIIWAVWSLYAGRY